MKCPYCGAELQENARFCLYCMKSLQDKQPIKVPTAKRRLWIALTVAAAAAVAVGLFLLLRQPKEKAGEPTPVSASEETSAATETESRADSELPAITDPNTFYFSAVQAAERMGTGGNLWQPASMWFPEETRAVVPLSIAGADCQVLFLEDGRAVFASVSGLTEDRLADGRRVAECIAAAVYDGVADAPTLFADLPMTQAERSVLGSLPVDDPAGEGATVAVTQCRFEPESFGGRKQTLLYELRTRSCEDGTYYDIFLYFGQE